MKNDALALHFPNEILKQLRRKNNIRNGRWSYIQICHFGLSFEMQFIIEFLCIISLTILVNTHHLFTHVTVESLYKIVTVYALSDFSSTPYYFPICNSPIPISTFQKNGKVLQCI